jgi:hypothetical protein
MAHVVRKGGHMKPKIWITTLGFSMLIFVCSSCNNGYDSKRQSLFQSMVTTYFNVILPAETVGMDFTNNTGSVKAMTDYGYVIVSPLGFTPKGSGVDISFSVVNPLSIVLEGMNVNFIGGSNKQQSLDYAIKIAPGQGMDFKAYLGNFSESDLKSVKVGIDFHSMYFTHVRNGND